MAGTTTVAAPTTTAGADADELAADLAAVGIAVYRDLGDSEPVVAVTQPVSPLALLAPQLLVLDAERRAGGGLLGASLDALAPVPDGAPPLSYLIAAWISTYDSPAAHWAIEIMGGNDANDWRHPQQIVFPRLLLVLFVADVSSAALGERAAGPSGFAWVDGGRPAAGQSPEIAAVCGLSNWVDQVIGSIFDAVKGDGSLPPVLQFIVDGAVTLAQGVVEAVVDAVMLPFDVIVGAITLVGVVGLISTVMWPWMPVLSIAPGSADHAGHPGESEQSGSLTLTFLGTPDLWTFVAECAQAAGIDLPSGSPAGAPISWQPAASPLFASIAGDPTVGADETAHLRFVTAWEATAPTPESTLHTRLPLMRARVEMISEQDIAKLIDTLIANLPFTSLLWQMFAPTVSSIGGHLAGSMYVEGMVLVTVTVHETPPPETTTTTPTTPPTTGPLDSCIDTPLTSQTPPLSTLLFAADGTATIDYTASPAFTEPVAPDIIVDYDGVIKMSWTPSEDGSHLVLFYQSPDTTFTATVSAPDFPTMTLTLEDFFEMFGRVTTDTATCANGTVTVASTGQVYS